MIFALLQVAAEVPAVASTAVVPPRVEAAVVIDGRLDEPVWSTARRLSGFHQYRPVDGRPADQATEVLVWYSPSAIYFGIVAHDRNPGSIRATVADRDKIENDDRVLIYLDTFNDHRRAFVFGVNALGIQEDGVRTEGSFGRGSGGGGSAVGFDRSPDYLFTSKGEITDSGYVVEVRIPFKSLRYASGNAMVWGLNVVRATQRSGFEDTWTDVKRGGVSFLAQAGTLNGLGNLKRGAVTEIQPFVTASANGLIGTDGRFERERIQPDAGANFRLGFTNLSLDGTINPDFSQVESDAGLVTLNERFALYFPERRPFFLEGIELFNSPGSIVYTRRIVNPVGGGKVTGKIGRFGIAHLTSVDDQVNPSDTLGPRIHPLVSMTRLRRDLGANSLAGLTFTDRSSGSYYNRVAQADTRLVLGSIYAVNAQLGSSWTRDTAGGRAGSIWSMGFDRTGRSWGFSYGLDGRSENFDAQLGFVPRVGDVNLRAFNRLSLFGAQGAFFEGVSMFAGFSRVWSYQDFGHSGPIEGDANFSGFGRIRGGWSYGWSTRLGFVDFDPLYYEGETVLTSNGFAPYHGLARLDHAFGFSASVYSPNLHWGGADARFERRRIGIFAEAAPGNETLVSSNLEFRPSQSIRLTGSGIVSRITRERDGSEFARTIIPRLKIELQPSREILFRVIGEYRSERQSALQSAVTGEPLYYGGVASTPYRDNRLRIDALLSYQPSPGTVAFLGYGSSYLGSRTLTFRNLVRQEDGFFVKLAYQFRS